MANSINATSTGNGGIITTGDDSGVLNIQTNETTAISIDASQNATFTNGANLPNTFGFKNRIINGGMAIDQRNAGASITPTDGQFTVDRWKNGLTAASKYSVQQSTTAPSGFGFSLLATSLSAYSVSSTDEFEVYHNFEGFNTYDLSWGTSDAKAVSLSFWARSSLTGTFGGCVMNVAGNRSFPFSYTISAANTWTYCTVAIPGDTTGTWVGATNGTSIQLFFNFGAGSTKLGTANTWTAGSLRGVTGQTNLVGTNGATLYLTGVQFEKSAQATSFDFRSYGTELALCQRYYQKSYLQSVAPYTGTAVGCVGGVASSTNYMPSSCSLPVVMRTTATFTIISASGTAGALSAAGNVDKGSSFVVDQPNDSRILSASGSGGALTAGTFYYFHFIASAEL